MSVEPKKYHESDAGDGSKAVDQHLTGMALIFTLLSAILALFASALDQTIVATLLTKVGEDFNDFEKVGWIASSYALPMATLAPSYGKISIAFGRKYSLIGGLVLFMVGSLIAARANSMNMLIGGRVIQGVGAGCMQAMVMVILTEIVPISKRSLSMMAIGITFSVASALGPFIGGAFTSHVTWRWCFYLNLPIGGIGIAALWFAYHPPKPKGNLLVKLRSIDYIGTFLINVGVILPLLAITFGGADFPWNSGAVISCFVLGVVALVAFAVYNFRYSSIPIIIPQNVSNPMVLLPSLCGFLAFLQFMVSAIYVALYLQVVLNNLALDSGIKLLPYIVSLSIASVVCGVFMRITNLVKTPLIFCATTTTLGSGLLLLLKSHTSFGTIFGVEIVNGVGAGFSFQPTLISAQLNAPSNVQGSLINVTTFNTFCKSLGGAVGVILGQLILRVSVENKMSDYLLTLTSQELAILQKYPLDSLQSNPAVLHHLPEPFKQNFLEIFVASFHNIFYFLLGISVLLIVLSLFTTNKNIPKDSEVEVKEKQQSEPVKSSVSSVD